MYVGEIKKKIIIKICAFFPSLLTFFTITLCLSILISLDTLSFGNESKEIIPEIQKVNN